MIGMGSIVLNRARVGKRAMLAAGSVVTEGGKIPPEVLAAGAPAEVKKPLDGASSEWVEMAAREYQTLRLKYMRNPTIPADGSNAYSQISNSALRGCSKLRQRTVRERA